MYETDPLKRRLSHRKYNQSPKGVARDRKRNTSETRKEQKREQRMTGEYQRNRPFVAWDGEACKDSGYSLFGCSDGIEISGWNLPTESLLDTMLKAETQNPTAIHVAFSFDYDVNMILKDLPYKNFGVLNETSRTRWNGYSIEHVPKKWFQVTKDGVTIKIYDVFGFFMSRYDDALIKYKIGTPELRTQITLGKDKRDDFWYKDLAEIRAYWLKELETMPQLMDVVRDVLYDAGFHITSWHGPSAVASYALRQHETKKLMGETPDEVQSASRYAFAGGRFESVKTGFRDGPVYTADLNSAYAHAITLLPSIAGKEWTHVTEWPKDKTPERFGVYRIRFHSSDSSRSREDRRRIEASGKVYPFFRRMDDGTICWPRDVENWYWTPEAQLVDIEPDAEILEAWIMEDDKDRPFEWVGELFQRRLKLQRLGHKAEKAYKWLLASMYGQMARRAGWKKYNGPPPTHQLEWAGFVTSWCRANIYRVAIAQWRAGNSIISIDTDGVTSAVPFGRDTIPSDARGDQLGQWKLEEYDGIFVWENGMYWLRDFSRWVSPVQDSEWLPPKTRGVPRRQVQFDKAWNAWQNGDHFKITRKTFIGYKRALRGQWYMVRKWTMREYEYEFGGNGKRYHNKRFCPQCARHDPDEYNFYGMCPLMDGVAMKSLARNGVEKTIENKWLSKPHVLPWLEIIPESERDLIFKDAELGAA